jgi:hypothetical protein
LFSHWLSTDTPRINQLLLNFSVLAYVLLQALRRLARVSRWKVWNPAPSQYLLGRRADADC